VSETWTTRASERLIEIRVASISFQAPMRQVDRLTRTHPSYQNTNHVFPLSHPAPFILLVAEHLTTHGMAWLLAVPILIHKFLSTPVGRILFYFFRSAPDLQWHSFLGDDGRGFRQVPSIERSARNQLI